VQEIWSTELDEEPTCKRGGELAQYISCDDAEGLCNNGSCAIAHFSYLLNISMAKRKYQVQSQIILF